MSGSRWNKLKLELKQAFAVTAEERQLTQEEDALLDRIALAIAKRSLTVPALMFLETIKPLNMVGSQMMAFFEPFAETIIKGKSYAMFRNLMEDRRSVSILMERIERIDREFSHPQPETKSTESEGVQ